MVELTNIVIVHSTLRVVFHPGQLSDHDADRREDNPTPFIFQKLFCGPGKISEL